MVGLFVVFQAACTPPTPDMSIPRQRGPSRALQREAVNPTHASAADTWHRLPHKHTHRRVWVTPRLQHLREVGTLRTVLQSHGTRHRF